MSADEVAYPELRADEVAYPELTADEAAVKVRQLQL